MHLSSFTLAIVAAAYLAVPGSADIIAFSGPQCNDNEGLNVPCDGGCIDISGRQSFEVVAGGLHCVTVFQDSNCVSLAATFPNQGSDLCQEIVTGTPTNSMRCSPNDSCHF